MYQVFELGVYQVFELGVYQVCALGVYLVCALGMNQGPYSQSILSYRLECS